VHVSVQELVRCEAALLEAGYRVVIAIGAVAQPLGFVPLAVRPDLPERGLPGAGRPHVLGHYRRLYERGPSSKDRSPK
jgi:hypothetical protein